MKERINIPDNIHLFKEVKTGDKVELQPFSTSEIPDTESYYLKRVIRELSGKRQEGGPNSVSITYAIKDEIVGLVKGHVTYRVVIDPGPSK